MSKIISVCPDCRKVVNFSNVGFKSKHIEDDIIEIGVECPHCQYWQHSYYLNDELTQKAEQVKNKSRKVRREYQLAFRKFQKKTRARYGISTQIHKAQKDEVGSSAP